MKAITRRATITLLPLAAAGASLPAIAAAVAAPAIPTNPDEALLQLVERWLGTNAEGDRMSAIIDAAYEKVRAENPMPPMPDVLRVRAEDHALGITDQDPHRKHFMAQQITWDRTIEPSSCPEYYDGPWIENLRQPRWGVVEKRETADDVEPYYVGGLVDVRFVQPSSAARARADEIAQAFDEWAQRRQDLRPPGVKAMERRMEAAYNLSGRLMQKIERTRAHTIAGLVAKAKVVARQMDSDDFGMSVVEDLLQLERG